MAARFCTSCGKAVEPEWRFCASCGGRLPELETTRDKGDQESPTPELRDERRRVAILFADVSGFTAMSDRLDAESVHEVMNDVFAGLGAAVRDEGGHIDKYIGDNMMALFGAPVAHEDDAARACRAALSMQAFLRQYARRTTERLGVQLRMRIGVNYGLVVAGGVGSDVKMQYSVMGDVVNVASRLETAAEPGTILVSKAVRDLTAGLFRFGESREYAVKGKPKPVTAYELRGDGQRVIVGARAERAFVGRDVELRVVREALGAPDARWLVITGPAGVGKSRLVEEAARSVEERALLTVAATSATRRRPFGLARRIMRETLAETTGAVACLERPDAFEEALADLDEALPAYREALWHVAAPTLAVGEAPDPDPQALRRTFESAFRAFLGAVSRRRPDLALFLDPLDHADEASLELMAAIRREGPSMPILCALREPAQGFPGDVELVPLDEADAGALLDRLLEGVALSDRARRRLLDRAAGVPLYLEELARFVAESGVDVERTDELPDTHSAALTSRIDRLGVPARDLLCQCAVQGVEFSMRVAEGVREIAPWRGPETRPLLALARGRALVTSEGADRHAFTPSLVRDACYELLLRRDRRALHARTADVLVALAGAPDHIAPDLLAHHELRAERWGPAAEACLRAGERTASLFLNDEALDFFAHALDCAARAGADAFATRAHAGAARVRLLVGDLDGALESAERMAAGNPEAIAESRVLVARVLAKRGRTVDAAEILDGVLAEPDVAPAVRADAWYDLSALRFRAGRIDDGLACLARSRDLLDAEDRPGRARCDLLEGRMHHIRGGFDSAQDLYERARDVARASGSLSQLAHAMNGLGICARDQGRYNDARARFAEALEVWSRMGDAECIAGAHNNLANLAISIKNNSAQISIDTLTKCKT